MSAELSAIPTASPIIADSAPKKPTLMKKPALAKKKPIASPVSSPASVAKILRVNDVEIDAFLIPEDVEVAEIPEDDGDEKVAPEMVSVTREEYERLLALAYKDEKTPKGKKGRIATKGADLQKMLADGEKVYSAEKVEGVGNWHATMRATYSSQFNGFTITEDDEVYNTRAMDKHTAIESQPYKKKGLISSPTSLCSYFRFIMFHRRLVKTNKSTSCGFVKCHILRDGVKHALCDIIQF